MKVTFETEARQVLEEIQTTCVPRTGERVTMAVKNQVVTYVVASVEHSINVRDKTTSGVHIALRPVN